VHSVIRQPCCFRVSSGLMLLGSSVLFSSWGCPPVVSLYKTLYPRAQLRLSPLCAFVFPPRSVATTSGFSSLLGSVTYTVLSWARLLAVILDRSRIHHEGHFL